MVASYANVAVTVLNPSKPANVQVANVVPSPDTEPPADVQPVPQVAVEPVFAVAVAVAVKVTGVP
jgi:hypothetical protein